MKVALLGLKGDFVRGTGSGIKNYMYYLYQGLVNSNVNVTKIELSKGILLKRFPWLNTYVSFGLSTISKDLRSYDIVHNPDNGHQIFTRRGKYTLITTVHGFIEFFNSEIIIGNKKNIKQVLYVQLMKKSSSSALKSDYLIAPSTQTRDEAIALGYDKHKIFISAGGVNEGFVSNPSTPKKICSEYRVGYIGGFGNSKNLTFAINAFKNLDNTIKFYIYGKKTSEYNNLHSYSAGMKNVKFMGFAPENKLVCIYDSFDVFVFPSMNEGLGLPIREAQSRGIPVIIYKYGKIPKEVRKYCFEAKNPEHMAQIIEDLKENGYKEDLRKKATEYARSFTWEKCARETLAIYNKVLDI